MIVAVHGFTGSPALFSGLPCHGLTVLGHGPSARASGPVGFADEVDRLASELPEKAVHLVGYSLGARLCLALALRHPHKVSQLTLVGGSPGLRSEEARAQRRSADAIWSSMLREEGIEKFVDAWQALPLWRSQRALPAERLQRQRQERLSHDASQLALALDSLGTGAMPSLWSQLPGLDVPVHLLVGALDSKYLDINREMATLLPHATLHVIEGSGHNPLLEQPEAAFRLLQEPLS